MYFADGWQPIEDRWVSLQLTSAPSMVSWKATEDGKLVDRLDIFARGPPNDSPPLHCALWQLTFRLEGTNKGWDPNWTDLDQIS